LRKYFRPRLRSVVGSVKVATSGDRDRLPPAALRVVVDEGAFQRISSGRG
jgi:predicted ribosome-associated RNA-binding protein Tma20